MSWLPTRYARSNETGVQKGIAGAIGGFLGGIGMGVIMQLGTDLMPLLGHFVGRPTAPAGWFVHLVTSVLFGLLFVAFVSLPLVADLADSVSGSTLLGVVHASVLATAMIGIGFPIITTVLSSIRATSGDIPGPSLQGFVPWVVFGLAHLVYGVVLGVVYALLRDGER